MRLPLIGPGGGATAPRPETMLGGPHLQGVAFLSLQDSSLITERGVVDAKVDLQTQRDNT